MGEESTRAEADSLRGQSGRRTVTEMVVVGLIASILGIILGLVIDWFPAQGSKQAGPIDTFWDVLIICSVPVFVLVTTVVLFAARNFRMRPGEEHLDGPPIHGNTRLEVIWTAIPAIMLVALCTYAYLVLHDIEKAPAAGNERQVTVMGQQFTWTFDYNEGGKKFSLGAALRARGRVGEVQRQDQGRPARLLGPGVADEDRRRPRHHHQLPRHADQARHLPGRLRRALRPRPRLHAPDRPRAAQGEVRRLGGQDVGAAPSRRLPRAAARRRRSTPRRSSARARRRPAPPRAAPATSSPTPAAPAASGPISTRSSRARTTAFIRESIVNPDAEIAAGFNKGIMPAELRQAPEQARGRRARQVPRGGGGQVTVKLRQPGWYRAGVVHAHRRGVRRRRISWLVRMAYGHDRYAHFLEAESIVLIGMFVAAVRVPGRPRLLRLLVLLGRRQADAPRGPLEPRRARRGRTTSARTPTTRSSGSSTRSTRSSSCSSAA